MKKIVFLMGIILALMSCAKEEGRVIIKIGYPAVGTMINGHVGQVLERTNILQKNNLKGKVIAFQYGPSMQEALLSGKMDVIFTSEANVVKLLAKGFQGSCIGSLGSGGRMGIMVLSDSKIKTIKDLKGKKVTTIFGSSVHPPIIKWIKEAGLIPDKDVKIINMGGGESRIVLIQGEVDAVMSWDPYIEDFIQKKTARIIKQTPLRLAIIMSKEFIEKNPEAAVNFLISIKESALFMATHRDEVNQWYSKLCRLDPKLIDSVAKNNTIYRDAKTIKDVDISVDEELIKILESIADFLFEQKLTSKKADISKGVNLELAKKADEKLSKKRYDPSKVKIIKKHKTKPFAR